MSPLTLMSLSRHLKPGSARQVTAQLPYSVDPVAVENLDVDAPVDPRTIRATVEKELGTTLIVLSKSCLIGLYGGVVGTFLGMLTVLGVTIYNEWSPVLDLRIIPLSIIFGITVGALSGLYAARRAMRVDPAIALRH